ncbi:MAG: LuxR C-terminal-related transcriptional regulator [Bacteroidales bacterium]
MKINVAIVEDDHEMRTGLKAIVDMASETQCIGAYPNAEAFIDSGMAAEAQVVLMDINLPGMSGITCVHKMKHEFPELLFMMCTVVEDDEKIFDSLCAGASGYMLKTSPGLQLINSIVELTRGGSPMSSSIARKVINMFRTNITKNSDLDKLSSREKEILSLLSKGYRYKEIAEKLFISIDTVRTHIRNIYDKLQVQSRTEAINKMFPNRGNSAF